MQPMFDNVSGSSSQSSSINSTTPDNTAHKMEFIVICGTKQLTGDSTDDLSDPLYLVDIQNGSSRKLPAFPFECAIKSITVNEKSIYVNGKISIYVDGKISSNRTANGRAFRRPIFRFNFESHSWETVTDRRGPPLTEYVFEVGKWLYLTWIQSRGWYRITNLSRFDLEENELTDWTDNTMKYRHPAFVRVDTMIYAIGGCLIMEDDAALKAAQEEDEFALPSPPRQLVSTVQRLNTESGEWTELAPMIEPKEELLCAVYNGKIYVLDGHEHPTGMSPQVYDIAANEWEWGPSLNRVYSSPAILVVVNDTLTFIDGSRFPLLSVERFSHESNSWVIAEDVEVKGVFQKTPPLFFPGVAKSSVS